MSNVVKLADRQRHFLVTKFKELRLVNTPGDKVTAYSPHDVARVLMQSGSSGFDYFSVSSLSGAFGVNVSYRWSQDKWVPVLMEAHREDYEKSFPVELQKAELGYYYDENGQRVFTRHA